MDIYVFMCKHECLCTLLYPKDTWYENKKYVKLQNINFSMNENSAEFEIVK